MTTFCRQRINWKHSNWSQFRAPRGSRKSQKKSLRKIFTLNSVSKLKVTEIHFKVLARTHATTITSSSAGTHRPQVIFNILQKGGRFREFPAAILKFKSFEDFNCSCSSEVKAAEVSALALTTSSWATPCGVWIFGRSASTRSLQHIQENPSRARQHQHPAVIVLVKQASESGRGVRTGPQLSSWATFAIGVESGSSKHHQAKSSQTTSYRPSACQHFRVVVFVVNARNCCCIVLLYV